MEDKASGRVHRFTPAVYLLVGQMNGQRTVDEIWQYIVEQLGDDAPTQGEVIQLLSQLSAADLLQTDIAPDPAEMTERFNKYTRARLRGSIGNPVAIKLPLCDPDRFLDRSAPIVDRLFSRVGAAIWILTTVPALILVAMHWGDLTENISDRVFGRAWSWPPSYFRSSSFFMSSDTHMQPRLREGRSTSSASCSLSLLRCHMSMPPHGRPFAANGTERW